MPPASNFEFRDKHDPEAAHIAVAAVIKAMLEEMEMQLDIGRIRQFLGSACGGDMTLIARAMWHVDWMRGIHDAEGDSDN